MASTSRSHAAKHASSKLKEFRTLNMNKAEKFYPCFDLAGKLQFFVLVNPVSLEKSLQSKKPSSLAPSSAARKKKTGKEQKAPPKPTVKKVWRQKAKESSTESMKAEDEKTSKLAEKLVKKHKSPSRVNRDRKRAAVHKTVAPPVQPTIDQTLPVDSSSETPLISTEENKKKVSVTEKLPESPKETKCTSGKVEIVKKIEKSSSPAAKQNNFKCARCKRVLPIELMNSMEKKEKICTPLNIANYSTCNTIEKRAKGIKFIDFKVGHS